MLNCGKEYDCKYVRENYSAPTEAVNVVQHRENCHMVFKFTRHSYSIYSIISLLSPLKISFSNLYKFLTFQFYQLQFKLNRGQQCIQQKVKRLKTGLQGDATICYENLLTLSCFHFRSENVFNIN